MTAPPEEVLARFEELTALETEFEDAELEIIRKSEALNAPLFKKRAAVISQIPHFWALVFEQSPTELDNYIQPTDSKLFADCLESLDVTRFEINDPKGSPRSVSIKFGFGPNEYFEDKVLEKKFWFRQTLEGGGWAGLVSEPVKIHWKKGNDLTGGLTDAAVKLWEAKKSLAKTANGNAKSKETSLPEYKALMKKIEENEDASMSFFNWFSYISTFKFISAEESEQALKVEAERAEKRKKGEEVEEDDPEDDDDFQQTEVFPQGEEVATIIAEDIFPSAIRYFKQAHEVDDEELSDLEIEDFDEDDSDNEIDIRALVGKGKKASSDSPPAKKRKT